MFLVNSRLTHFTATSLGLGRRALLTYVEAILFPKLRIQIAEFLSECYLKRLRILSSPTCVGFRYGHRCELARGFSWQPGRAMTLWAFGPGHHLSRLASWICLRSHATGLDPHFHSGAHPSFCVTPIARNAPPVVQEF